MNVHLCTNDKRGHSTGLCCAIEIYDGAGEFEVYLEMDPFGGAPFKWVSDGFQLGEQRFPCDSRRSFVGNIHWEAAEVPNRDGDVRRLVEHALALGFTVTEYVHDGPFAALIDPPHNRSAREGE